MEDQLKGNKLIAGIIREQANIIKKQKEIETEIQILEKQEIVASVLSEKHKPLEAVESIFKQNIEEGKKIREELLKAQAAKEAEDKEIELLRADKIRQLKAVNTVHRKHIKVFDPTTVVGPLFLDQMSYMEMKERQAVVVIHIMLIF